MISTALRGFVRKFGKREYGTVRIVFAFDCTGRQKYPQKRKKAGFCTHEKAGYKDSGGCKASTEDLVVLHRTKLTSIFMF
jgi:hypothetical protein